MALYNATGDSDGDGIPDGSDPSVLSDFLDTLSHDAFASRGPGHRTAMQSRLAETEQAIADRDVDQAIRQLQNLPRKVDGCGATADGDDWIVYCAAQIAVRDLIDTMIAALGA